MLQYLFDKKLSINNFCILSPIDRDKQAFNYDEGQNQ